MVSNAALFIPWLPALAAVLCGICCMNKKWRQFSAPLCIASIASAFVATLVVMSHGVAPFDANLTTEQLKNNHVVTAFEWINSGNLSANFSYFIDSLTLLMLCVITLVGTLIAIYAAGYMKGEKGYARFFAAMSLFIFAMTTLVMADNLLLIYLGWEGVGLCSYLLIGYYYDKPTAVKAAKKAFIVNRIGDLGFALGIFLIYTHYQTLSLHTVLKIASNLYTTGGPIEAADTWIPYLLMLGAFGKSAQFPLYVWLPDAMAGPTPVSALVHAATMVTSGLYLITRMFPIFLLSEYALPTVATVGALTACFAATIGLCQNDIKKVFAYSTISQLGYMFLGLGVLSAVGGMFHVFTHAFFKALLFLTGGSVMHGLAGQLDIRKISGLRKKMPVTCWLMFCGCLALAGVPYIAAGFYSKDMILADALAYGLNDQNVANTWIFILAFIGIFTAFLTAFYTFRVWFRVFWGPTQYEMGDDHGHDDHDNHADAHHDAHEMPWSMNAPLVVLAIGAILAGVLFQDTITQAIQNSTGGIAITQHVSPAPEATQHHAAIQLVSADARTTSHPTHPAEALTHTRQPEHEAEHHQGHPLVFGLTDAHTFMVYISFIASLGGIFLAWYYHLANRSAATAVANRFKGITTLFANKWYVDEIFDVIIVKPLYLTGQFCFVFDKMIIDTLVAFIGWLPRLLGLGVQPLQSGKLQGYGLGMALGIAAIAAAILLSI